MTTHTNSIGVGFLNRLHRHLARHHGELLQELSQRVPAFQIVDEIFEGNARAEETRRSVHDLGIDNNDRL